MAFPSHTGSLFGDFHAPLLAELRGAFRAPDQTALACVVLAGIWQIFGNLARRDLHHAHGVPDHVSGALLTLRTFRHVGRIAWLNRDAKRIGFQTETLPEFAGNFPILGGVGQYLPGKSLLVLRAFCANSLGSLAGNFSA